MRNNKIMVIVKPLVRLRVIIARSINNRLRVNNIDKIFDGNCWSGIICKTKIRYIRINIFSSLIYYLFKDF